MINKVHVQKNWSISFGKSGTDKSKREILIKGYEQGDQKMIRLDNYWTALKKLDKKTNSKWFKVQSAVWNIILFHKYIAETWHRNY